MSEINPDNDDLPEVEQDVCHYCHGVIPEGDGVDVDRDVYCRDHVPAHVVAALEQVASQGDYE